MLSWVLMLLQLCISATLTALGSVALHDGTPITVLGAINTIAAGVLAFLHNSGLPDRYRYDMDEFREVEDHIREILDSGIAPDDLSTEQVLAECFDLYRDAKATVTANMPDNYRTKNGKIRQGTASTPSDGADKPATDESEPAEAPLLDTSSESRQVTSAAPGETGTTGMQHNETAGKQSKPAEAGEQSQLFP